MFPRKLRNEINENSHTNVHTFHKNDPQRERGKMRLFKSLGLKSRETENAPG
jgi:hypothetical protein